MKIPSEVLWARTLGMCLVGNKLWYSPMAFNGIFCADLHTGTTELISKFSGFDDIYNGLKFSYVLHIGDYLYFCPYKSNCIGEVNCMDAKMNFYSSDLISTPYVSNAICIQNKLYLFCSKQLQIIVFDLKNKDISIIKNEYFMERFAKGYYPEKDIVYNGTSFFLTDDQKIISLDIQSQEVYDHDLSQWTAGKNITTIASDGECFWIMCDDSEIIGWNGREEDVQTYKVHKLGQAVHSIINGANLYIFFADNNSVLTMHLPDRKISVVKINRGYCCEQGEEVFFHPFVDDDNKKGVYIYTFIEHKIIYLEPNGNVNYIKLNIDQKDTVYKEIYTNYLQKIFYPVKGIMREQKDLFYYSLESYLRGISAALKGKEDIKSSIGEKIYCSI